MSRKLGPIPSDCGAPGSRGPQSVLSCEGGPAWSSMKCRLAGVRKLSVETSLSTKFKLIYLEIMQFQICHTFASMNIFSDSILIWRFVYSNVCFGLCFHHCRWGGILGVAHDLL